MPAKVAPETSSTKSDVKKSSMMPMIVGAIALVVVIAVAVVLAITLGSSDSSSAGPTISTSFSLSGDVSSFTETDKTALLLNLAIAAGFTATPAGSTIAITSASVDVLVTFPVADATAAATVYTSLEAAAGSIATLQTIVNTAMGTSAPTVVTAPTYASAGVTMPPAVPPSPSPSPSPAPPPRAQANAGPFTSGCQSNPLAGRWMGNFGTSFVINNTMWLEISSSGGETHKTITKFTSTYAIMQMPADDAWNPGKWVKSEFHSNGDGTYGMCNSVFDALTAALAESTDTSTVYNSASATAGCNGFGHTVMTPYASPLAGQWTGNFGTAFSIDDTYWREGTSVLTIVAYTNTMYILQNPPTDSWNPSVYVKAEYHSNGDGTYGMCKSVFSAVTAKLAINTDTSTIYNSSNAAGGCNGFGHTVMTPLP